VLCHKIDIDGLKLVRDQLWAEALHYAKGNTPLHFEDVEIEAQAIQEQLKRIGVDPWHEIVAQWLDNEVMKSKDVVSGNQIFCDCLGGKATQFNRNIQLRLSNILRQLGWVKGVYRMPDGEGLTRGYKRPNEENAF
jgi:putative DNA primase/helicase